MHGHMNVKIHIPYSQCHRGPQSSDNPLLVSHTIVWTVIQCVTIYTKECFASMGCSSRYMSITHCILIRSIQLSLIEQQNVQYGCATLPIKTIFKQYNKFWPYRIPWLFRMSCHSGIMVAQYWSKSFLWLAWMKRL